LLNEQEVTLDTKTLVIADAFQPQAIAGVMGGMFSGVNETTRDILLESAFFTSATISHATQKYKLISDASERFERGVDPQLANKAMARVTELILQIAGGVVGDIIDTTTVKYLPKNYPITLRKSRIKRMLGIEITDKDVNNIFQRLNMQVEKN